MDSEPSSQKSLRERPRSRGLGVFAAGSLALGHLTLLPSSAAAQFPSECTASGTTVTCTYSSPGQYVLDLFGGTGDLHVVAVGGSGGAGMPAEGIGGSDGGRGAQVTSVISEYPPRLFIFVGSDGVSGHFGGAGGFNGGGNSGSGAFLGGGGGGASDIRRNPADLDSQLIVAAGGGGGGAGSAPDNSGGHAGAAGGSGVGGGGGSGTESSGGTGGSAGSSGDSGSAGNAGIGGNGGGNAQITGGGGGSGLYGGGGGGADAAPGSAGGGGGGSSFGDDISIAPPNTQPRVVISFTPDPAQERCTGFLCIDLGSLFNFS